jgi:hypothetical protein
MMKRMWIVMISLVLLFSAGGAASAMDVIVVMPGGQAMNVTIKPENTIAQLKEKVYSASELNPLNQIMFIGNQKLDEKRTVASYSIANGDTLLVKHGVINAPTQKEKGNGLLIFLIMAAIVGIGVFFMRKKPNREFDGK